MIQTLLKDLLIIRDWKKLNLLTILHAFHKPRDAFSHDDGGELGVDKVLVP